MEDVMSYQGRDLIASAKRCSNNWPPTAQEQDMGYSSKMSQYTVLFDANVLYPAPMRDALMQLAVTDLFKAKWTADIPSRMD